MSVLERIAYYQKRRDEVPNQELARELVKNKDVSGIAEIAAGLNHKSTDVQNDCIKVLYEVGYLAPELVAGYAGDFIKLLRSRENRQVWGGMIALSTVAHLSAGVIDTQRGEVIKAIEKGSVITVDGGILTLAKLAASGAQRNREIFPFLLNHLQTCRPKDVPQHCEKILAAVNSENAGAFITTLEKRIEDLSPTQLARVRKVIQKATQHIQEQP